jgi:exodeoxyribonuclease VII large subunit
VVRAAANCPIPLISAVGHETDTTLIDFAADRRAPTPTAAAELAVPARAELMAMLDQTSARLLSCGQATLNHARLRLSRVEARMPDLPGLVGAARQRLDDRAERLGLAPVALLHRKRAALDAIAPRLPHPRETLAGHRHALAQLETRATGALHRLTQQGHTKLARIPDPAAGMAARMREARLHLSGLGARLEGASYQGVLARGFALVRTEDGHPVTAAAAVAPGARLSIALHDGTLNATADGAAPPPPKRAKPTPKPEQGSLL